jgi:YHS domain-containing protein
MSWKMRLSGHAVWMAAVVFVALVAVALFSGCKREQPPVPQTQGKEQMPMHDHAVMDRHDHAAMAQAKPAAAEQTTCPVMGGAINKDVFVEYKGKRVYFCCKGCDKTFQANPERYIAKLPQFQD